MYMSNIERRLPTKTADEFDVVSKWRHVHCYTSRPGVCSDIKRQMRRRERAVAKLEIKTLSHR